MLSRMARRRPEPVRRPGTGSGSGGPGGEPGHRRHRQQPNPVS